MNEKLFPIETRHFKLMPCDVKEYLGKWTISLKDGNQKDVGNIHFEDTQFKGEVKIFVELLPEYEEPKYIEEIFFMMARFVFRDPEIGTIRTQCDHENEDWIKGIEKAGYVYREFKDGYDQYSMNKQKTSWMGLYMFLGMIAGFIIGITFSNLWAGTISGVLTGSGIGYLLDKKTNIRKDK
ncbi:hypothetical protein SAMN02745229_00875 [Butyrivibrio fibrisolvens DSM 3071]|uniref:N-acetyltransferase domain-containing protein n=1 Tax=Butyrivibrio fibrisolvens DSM 3071 TaxID=1121131 RepID=A0A1M5V5I0_BUTFI|nr:GNAT family N-acetyltransferase [Butyrivibrio fibrisolvens]SHH70364.1 hypothetical protein SAMN02745229_00875 [Butyrivibrio fibrisolvens DSM 3071]